MLTKKFTTTLKHLWSRIWLRKVGFSARYRDIEWLYKIEDPWNLQSAKERARFEASNAVIQRVAPHCQSLLEVGCGEGFQTELLQLVSPSVVGLDVSQAAIERARFRCPNVEFHVGKAEDAVQIFADRRFDVVTAFEVLYYAADIPATIKALQRLGERVVVSNYRGRAELMRSYFSQPGWIQLDDVFAGGTTWEVQIWEHSAAHRIY